RCKVLGSRARRSELQASADVCAGRAEPDIERRRVLRVFEFAAQEEVLSQGVIEAKSRDVARVPLAGDLIGYRPGTADLRRRRWDRRRRVGAIIRGLLAANGDVDELGCVDLRNRDPGKAIGQEIAVRPAEAAA